MDEIIKIILIGAFFAFFAILIWSSLRSEKKRAEHKANASFGSKPEQENGQTPYTDAQEDGIDIPPYMEMRATVVDMHCQVRMVGLKQPKTVTEFCVCFENDEGKVFAVPVNEEMYQGFETGQRGVLRLCAEDILYSFEPFEEK